MQESDPINEEGIRRLLHRGLPEDDPKAARRLELVLRRCSEQVYGRDTVTLLFARAWVALLSLLAHLLSLSRGRTVARIAAHFAAAPPG
jgi:hypothetical protein